MASPSNMPTVRSGVWSFLGSVNRHVSRQRQHPPAAAKLEPIRDIHSRQLISESLNQHHIALRCIRPPSIQSHLPKRDELLPAPPRIQRESVHTRSCILPRSVPPRRLRGRQLLRLASPLSLELCPQNRHHRPHFPTTTTHINNINKHILSHPTAPSSIRRCHRRHIHWRFNTPPHPPPPHLLQLVTSPPSPLPSPAANHLPRIPLNDHPIPPQHGRKDELA